MPCLQHTGRDGSRQSQNGTDREIDPTGENDQGHADRQAEIDRDLTEDVPAVVWGEELVREQGHRHHHQDESDQRLELGET